MKTLLERLKSPVVWFAIISAVATIVISMFPSLSDQVQQISAAITGVITAFAALNNPTDHTNF